MHVENGVVVPKQGVAPMELIVLAVGGLVLLLNLTLMAYMLMSMQLLVHSGNAQHGANGGEL